MKVAIAHRSGEVHILDVDPPQLGPRTALVHVTHCAVSPATELMMIRQVQRYLQPNEDGIPLGYSCAGMIESVGPETQGLKPGLKVACYGAPFVYHAETLSVPQNLVVELPKRVNHEEGAFTGIGAIAVHAYRLSGLGLGETAVVLGAGLTGNLVAQVCRAGGAAVLIADALESRLQKARNAGIPHALRLGSDILPKSVAHLSGGIGADAVIVCDSSDEETLALGADLLRDRGRLVIVGGGGDLRLPEDILYLKEADVRVARAAGPGRYDPLFERDGVEYPTGYVRWNVRRNMALFAALLSERRVQIAPLITDRIPLERATSAYEKLLRGMESCYSIVLTT